MKDQGFPLIPDVAIPGSGGSRSKITPEIISPTSHSPSKIHRGFMPANYDGFDATNSADLPGSRDEKVITTPPHSQSGGSSGKLNQGASESRQRAQSIEEADKHRENYVPLNRAPGDPPLKGTEEENSYCLGSLSSYIISQESGHDSGRKGEIKSQRKTSGASEASTLSVSSSSSSSSSCSSSTTEI